MNTYIALIVTVLIWYFTLFRLTFNLLGKDVNSIPLWIVNLVAFVTLWTLLRPKLEEI